MGDRFVALPVSQGDAFFLQRGGFSALVDGGRSCRTLPNLFRQVLKRERVTALVCTHNDADHATGILGFLESSLAGDEVWLPGRWSERLDDLLDRQHRFVEELAENVQSLDQPSLTFPETGTDKRLEDLGDELASTSAPTGPPRDRPSRPDDPAPARALKRRLIDHAPCDWAFLPIDPLLASALNVAWPPQRQLFLDGIRAARRIARIAWACSCRKIRIRWFAFDEARSAGGARGLLEPVNAVERNRPPPSDISAVAYLALTVANRESLVFASPRGDHHPGVLLAADSDLRFNTPIRWENGMIVTAPHHGSHANAAAYSRHADEACHPDRTIWVRSDGRFRTRPGASFLQQPRRFCTVCRNDGRRPAQPLRCHARGGFWRAVVPTRRCRCA